MTTIDSHTPRSSRDVVYQSPGKAYRMSRLFGPDHRSVILPIDHGSMLGRVPGLEDPIAVLERMLPLGCDAFLMALGLAERSTRYFEGRGSPARLITLDSYWKGTGPASHVLITTLERAVSLGVDGVKVLMPWDGSPEDRGTTVAFIAEVITRANDFSLPVIVEPLCLQTPRGPDAVAIEGDGARVAAELGADILKLAYPDEPETLAAWSSELGVPIFLLGGPAGRSPDDLYVMVERAIANGAVGIAIGRQVWQRPPSEAVQVLETLISIVHRPQAAAPQPALVSRHR